MGTMRLIVDGQEQALPEERDTAQLRDLVRDPGSRFWLDLADPTDTDVETLREVFGFHELALEEVTRPHERPRCDSYGGYYFIVVYAAEHIDNRFLPRELNLFWGPNFLVTIHRRPAAVLSVLETARRRWERHESRQAWGISCLAYTLFESLVDGYFMVQDRIRERMEEIEDAIFSGADSAAADLFRLRKELLRVPRLLAPTSNVLAEVLRRDQSIPDGLRPYLADVQDHAVHVLAELDTYRDLLAAALDVQVFYSFNRLGLVMKRLTAVTVVIMVPNFVASVFGMNFDFIPMASHHLAFFFVTMFLAVMVAWGFIHSRILGWL